jgi:hypothetical protein
VTLSIFGGMWTSLFPFSMTGLEILLGDRG